MGDAIIERVAAVRAQLWDAGFRPLAVFNYDYPNPKMAGKAPLGKDWGNRARQDPPECLRFPPVKHALNTGILCDGLRAIDIDVDNTEIATRCRSFVVQRFGEAPIRMRKNSPRCLILYRAAHGAPDKVVLAGTEGKIEVLGKGQQFVAFGRHPSGADLEWFPDAPGQELLASIPHIEEPDLIDLLNEIAPIIGAEPIKLERSQPVGNGAATADGLEIAAALYAIPNVGAPDWEAWNKVGMAVWAATEGSEMGFIAFNAWSARHPSYDQMETRARWEHYFESPPDKTGAGKLFRMAREATQPEQPRSPVDAPIDVDGAPIFPVEMFRDITIPEDANDFVEGLLIKASMAVIYGESNSGKTFFATDLGLHVACGWPWNGRDVERGAVIYLALEGSHGIRNRIAAFRTEHGLQDKDIPFAVIPVAMNLLDPDADTGKLIRTIQQVKRDLGMPVVLTVADTLSRAMSGGNENAPDDMGALVTNGTRIQQETQSALAWVHHSGKDQAKGARGHSLLRAATDTEIEITSDGGHRHARVTKQRDIESSGEFAFSLKVVELGTNHRWKPITSCVVVYQAEAEGRSGAQSTRLTGHPKRALELLADLCARTGQTGHWDVPANVPSVPADWWRESFYQRAMPGSEQDTKKHAFGRASSTLLNARLVGMAGNRVWLASAECNIPDGEGNGT